MAKQLQVTLTRSLIGRTQAQKDTVQSLGLRKIRQSAIHQDTASVRGMISKVNHLVEVKEIN